MSAPKTTGKTMNDVNQLGDLLSFLHYKMKIVKHQFNVFDYQGIRFKNLPPEDLINKTEIEVREMQKAISLYFKEESCEHSEGSRVCNPTVSAYAGDEDADPTTRS